jgi:hypothetical protein
MQQSQKKSLNLKEAGFKTSTRVSTRSSGMIAPGDVITFTYPKSVGHYAKMGSPVLALVVSNKRTGGGALFLSRRGNKLLSTFDISGSPPEVVKIILRELYKKRRKCSYRSIKGLKSILGSDSYRTYNVKSISKLYEIFLK